MNDQQPLFADLPDAPRKSPAVEADAALELEAIVGECLQLCLGLHGPAVLDLANKMVKVLRVRHGGGDVYIPAADKTERNAAIRAALRTGNAAEVAADHDLNPSTVYKIARRR